MSDNLFDFVAKQIERRTPFDRLESRGTLRIVIKAAGLDVKTVTAAQLGVAIEQLMPEELRRRGVGAPEAICRSLKQSLADASIKGPERRVEVDEIFGRLGGNWPRVPGRLGGTSPTLPRTPPVTPGSIGGKRKPIHSENPCTASRFPIYSPATRRTTPTKKNAPNECVR